MGSQDCKRCGKSLIGQFRTFKGYCYACTKAIFTEAEMYAGLCEEINLLKATCKKARRFLQLYVGRRNLDLDGNDALTEIQDELAAALNEEATDNARNRT